MTIDELAEELESVSEWRSQKAAQYRDDSRNTEAAELLTKLAEELRRLGDTPELTKFRALYEFVIHDCDKDGENEISEVCRRWAEYRSRIGFDHFPSSAQEYVRDLVEIVHEAAPSAAYLF
jgi:hypothetical protein